MKRLALLGVFSAAVALAAPWPGESFTQAVDLTPLVPGTAGGFGQQVSDLHWNPVTRTLWVARAPGGVWALTEADGGFQVAAKYAAINSDYEGITHANLSEASLYVFDEPAGAIRKYAVDGAGGSTLLRTWNLAGVVPPQSGNAGPEGLAFVPDDALKAAGFPTRSRCSRCCCSRERAHVDGGDVRRAARVGRAPHLRPAPAHGSTRTTTAVMLSWLPASNAR